jgi:hypothetical protein
MSTIRATSVATFALIVVGLIATSGFTADLAGVGQSRDPLSQVAGQVTRLVSTIKDECAKEYPTAREIKFVDVPNSDRIAVATFFIEGFGGGNNSHQFLAVFVSRNIPRVPTAPPYYSLAAVVEVGEGCGVHATSVRVSTSRDRTRPNALSLSFPTFVSSTIGSCNGSTRATYLFDPAMEVGQLTRQK